MAVGEPGHSIMEAVEELELELETYDDVDLNVQSTLEVEPVQEEEAAPSPSLKHGRMSDDSIQSVSEAKRRRVDTVVVNDGNPESDNESSNSVRPVSKLQLPTSIQNIGSWLANLRAQQDIDPREVLYQLLDEFDLDDVPDALVWNLVDRVGLYLSVRAVPFREKISHINTFDHFIDLIKESSNVLVLSGAGVSVSCGIPDFRSSDGIYSRLKQDFDLPSPESMFDLGYFRKDSTPFFRFAKEIWPSTHKPSPSHHFIALLESHGKLLRNYSQNIDDLEHMVGIQRVIQCHGSFATASCLTCHRTVPGKDIEDEILSQRKPYCSICRDPSSELDIGILSDENYGLMKPDIIFFGERLPEHFFDSLESDLDQVDLCIVMGSSLKVSPVADIISKLPNSCPLVLINREVVGYPNKFDVLLLGNCDEVVGAVCSKLGPGWEIPNQSDSEVSNFQFIAPNCYLFPGHIRPGSGNFDELADESEDSEHSNCSGTEHNPPPLPIITKSILPDHLDDSIQNASEKDQVHEKEVISDMEDSIENLDNNEDEILDLTPVNNNGHVICQGDESLTIDYIDSESVKSVLDYQVGEDQDENELLQLEDQEI